MGAVDEQQQPHPGHPNVGDAVDSLRPRDDLRLAQHRVGRRDFETGYAFREQLDTIIGPFLPPELIALLDEGAPEVSGPGWDLLNLVEGVQLTGFTAERLAEFRDGVGRALAEGDWGHYDTYEWERFVADPTTGDFSAVMEFI